MAKYDWEFIKPLDQSATIANMAYGNKQITDGLQGMVGAVTGLADTYKQRNTDEILNALYSAQTSADLPNAMSAVQALQAKLGRGYDQAKIREAIDSRGSTLGQRDLQAINLQQAQAAQAALPQIKQMQIERLKASGAPQAQIDALAGIDGIDVSSFATGLIGDARDTRDYTDKRNDRAEDLKIAKEARDQTQENWQAEFDLRKDKDNWDRAGDLSKENPPSSGYGTDAAGNLVTISNPGINRMDAYGALSSVRGIRNNNPGNIEFYNQPGASLESKGGRFARFSTPEQGINAMSKQLDLYYTGKSRNVSKPINTIQDIITTWAPPKNKKGQVENDTAAYIASVAKAMGVSPTDKLNLKDPNTKAALMAAMITHENGGNPYTHEQYIAGITGKTGTASQALANVGGGPVSQAKMSEVSSGYQNAIAKLTADFNADTLKSQKKGSLAETGKSLSTWAAGKKDNGIIFAGNNSWFTSASDLVAMAKKDPTFSKLPETAQINILEGAYAKMNDVNKLQYVPDGDLQKFISTESKNYHTNRKAAFNQAKEAEFEKAYQNMVQQFQAVGSHPPSRESARQLLDPTYKPKAQAKPQRGDAKTGFVDNPFHSEPTPKATAKQASEAVKPTSNRPLIFPLASQETSKTASKMVSNAQAKVGTTKAQPTAAKKALDAVAPKQAPKQAAKPAGKPTKNDIVDFYVKRGKTDNIIPNGLNSKADRQLIQEAKAEAQRRLQKSKEAAQKKEADKKAKQRDELARIRKEFAEREAKRIAAQKEEERKRKANLAKFHGLVG